MISLIKSSHDPSASVGPADPSGMHDTLMTEVGVDAEARLLGSIRARGKSGRIGLYFGGTRMQAETIRVGSFATGKTNIH